MTTTTTTREPFTPQDEVQEKVMKNRVQSASRSVQMVRTQEGPLMAGIQDLESFVKGLPAAFDALKDQSIGLATYLRNAIARALWNVRHCWHTIVKLFEISEEIGSLFKQAHTCNLWSKVEILRDMVDVAVSTVPLFESLCTMFEKGITLFNEVQENIVNFVEMVKNLTIESITRVRRDLAKIQVGMQAACHHVCDAVRLKVTHIIMACGNMCSAEEAHPSYVAKPTAQIAVSRGFGGPEGIIADPRFVALLQSLIGKEGMKLLFDLQISNQSCGSILKSSAKDMNEKIEAMRAPPETASEWLLSPFSKVYEAIDLADEFAFAYENLPGVWAVLSTNIHNFMDYIKRLQDYWINIWNGFMQLVIDLCSKFGVKVTTDFTNDGIIQIDFDPFTGGFLASGCQEHYMQCAQCVCCTGVKNHLCNCYSHCYWGLYNAYSHCYWGIAERCHSGGRKVRIVQVKTS